MDLGYTSLSAQWITKSSNGIYEVFHQALLSSKLLSMKFLRTFCAHRKLT
jgi:hypothetical protein